MNLTLLSLSASVISNSPLFLFPSAGYDPFSFTARQVHLNMFFQSFLSSYSNLQATITNSMFIGFLDTPLKIENKNQISCIEFQNYNTTQSIKKSDVCINSCNFINCKNSGPYARGGAIRFECLESVLTVHASTFTNCTSVSCGGAIFACGEEEYSFDSNSYLMTHKNMKSFNSHYCCYSGCSAQSYDKSDTSSIRYSGYGSALLVASDDIELNYSASINCPKIDDSHAYGAQFDLKTNEVKSCFINATKGDSICCAAIEYRNAQSGFFCYQTIVDQIGAFITSFSSLEGSVSILSCNLVNNTLRYLSNVDLCSLIYVMYKDVIISNFVVAQSNIDNSVQNNNKPAHFAAANNNDVTVTVENCKIDQSMIKSEYFKGVTTKDVFIQENPKTHSIGLLKLGDCAGIVVPPSIFETSHFTDSEKFTFSNDFSQSSKFTSSTDFPKSGEFTDSGKFSSSDGFSNSEEFSSSGGFSNSEEFSSSDGFSNSEEFSSSDGFSNSKEFSSLADFSNSKEFSSSSGFSNSKEFSSLSGFSNSKEFSSLSGFSNSKEFSSSDGFSSSKEFSSSGDFSSSKEFSETSQFSMPSENSITSETPTPLFSSSGFFSSSLEFTPSMANVKIVIRDSNARDKSNNLPLIGGIAGSAALAAAASCVTIFIMRWKKKASQLELDIQEPSNASSSEVIIQNPLCRKDMDDDPFQNDFAEHIASLDTVL